jgi:hypothetical protein
VASSAEGGDIVVEVSARVAPLSPLLGGVGAMRVAASSVARREDGAGPAGASAASSPSP